MERQSDECGRKPWIQVEEQASMKEHTTSKAWFYLALACSFSARSTSPATDDHQQGRLSTSRMVAGDRTPAIFLATPARDFFTGHFSRPCSV
jgi:hypothetical protein